MKNKLIELLGLKPAAGQDEVTDDQIVFEVSNLQSRLLQHHGAADYERALNDVMLEGGGAINRTVAGEILAKRQREANGGVPR
jgi:hypothetical protein